MALLAASELLFRVAHLGILRAGGLCSAIWILGPDLSAVNLYFLLRVTGIPATEEQALRSKGDKYREYQRTTSVFIPWFPG